MTTSADARDIIDACTRLSLDYSFHADQGAHDAWASLFAEDGELIVFGQTQKGRATIRASVGQGPEMVTMHCVSNIRVNVLSGTEAEGSVYAVVYVAPKGDGVTRAPLTPAVVGFYHDRYTKTAEGWRFAARAFKPAILPPA